MNLNEESKKAVQELSEAINAAVEESLRVTQALLKLRELGYDPDFSLKLDMCLREVDAAKESELDFTDEDLKTLRKMKINP